MNERPNVEVIRLTGELDVARKDALRGALKIPPAAGAVLLDLADVTYADSTALTELMRFRMEAERKNVRIAIVATSPQFDRVIRYAGLNELFSIFGDRGAALEYLERAS